MKDTMIGRDLAKNVFQLHGANNDGEPEIPESVPDRQRSSADAPSRR